MFEIWLNIFFRENLGKRELTMKKSINDIKIEFQRATKEEGRRLCELYAEDSRAGVQKLIKQWYVGEEKLQKEKERVQLLWEYERKYSEYQAICGIDEVGRGPLAGPVVAGAVILPKNCEILYINDSKKLSEKQREALYDEIQDKAISIGIGIVEPEMIDEINILQATYEAMRKAISNLSVTPDLLLNDAVTIPNVSIKQVPIIKGDAKSISIGAASIIAKVTRDRMMKEYSKQYKEYGFESNKGYGSKDHIEALKKYGACEIHRKSFIKGILE